MWNNCKRWLRSIANQIRPKAVLQRGPWKNQFPLCKKNVQKGAQALQCEYISVWHHTLCEYISDEEYNSLTRRGQQLHWYCKTCNAKAVDVLIMVQSMKEQQDKMKAEILQLADKVEELVKVVEPTFRKNIKREEMYKAKERDMKKNQSSNHRSQRDAQTKMKQLTQVFFLKTSLELNT